MQYNKSITATVYVIHEGRVLLHWHKKYKTWFPLGGHIEADEFPHEAAIREVREESGLSVRLLSTELAPAIELARVERIPAPFCLLHEGIGSEETFFDFIYVAEAEATELHPADDESRELRWFSREELEREPIKIHIKNTALAVFDFWQSTKTEGACMSEKEGAYV